MSSSCNCTTKLNEFLENEIDEDPIVQFRQWEMTNNRFELSLVQENLSEAVSRLKMQLPNFLLHHFINKQTQATFMEARENASNKSVVIQVDFAENYTCQYQDEIQSAHWNNPQVAVFTVVVW